MNGWRISKKEQDKVRLSDRDLGGADHGNALRFKWKGLGPCSVEHDDPVAHRRQAFGDGLAEQTRSE